MGIEPGLRAGAQRLHISGKARNECICAVEISGGTHRLELTSGVNGVRYTERHDRASELVRSGSQRRAVARVDRRSHGVDLHRNRFDEEFREVANQRFVAVFVEEDGRIEDRHRVNCTQ